jgi:hypothetical protein
MSVCAFEVENQVFCKYINDHNKIKKQSIIECVCNE